MNISELRQKLFELMDEYGDLDITIWNDWAGEDVSSIVFDVDVDESELHISPGQE